MRCFSYCMKDHAKKWLMTLPVGTLITWAEANPSMPINFDASMKSWTEVESANFNKRYPTTALADDCNKSGAKVDRGIYYYSWGGTAQTTNLLDIDTILMQIELGYGRIIVAHSVGTGCLYVHDLPICIILSRVFTGWTKHIDGDWISQII